ncbi:MAG: hypothetical protein VX000_05680, partial [Myxococcota bacterium]|nr:hypothetical protein [Myxococcota bacterium]
MPRFDPAADYPAALRAEPRDRQDADRLDVPAALHDDAYERPVRSRYVDPLEVIWLATSRRLALTIRRDPDIFSMTDGTGLMSFSTRTELDEDDNLAQMTLHEICHWVTNGVDTYHQRDWGFPLWEKIDVREHACVRLQCWLASRFGLREMFGPTGCFRQYYDALPDDPLAARQTASDAEAAWEEAACRIAAAAVTRVQREPFWSPLCDAMSATAALRDQLAPFSEDYQSEHEDDALP